MHGGQHSSAELTISVKVQCHECGGRGFVETVTESGHIVGDPTSKWPCLWRSRSHPGRHASVAVPRAVEDHLGWPVRSTLLGVHRLSPCVRRVGGEAVELKVGDRVEVEAESTEQRPRKGVIEEVVREAPSPRYRIRWDDGHESIYTPAAGALRRARRAEPNIPRPAGSGRPA